MEKEISMRPIAALVGITLETPQLDAMIDFYVDAFGLTLLARDNGTARLGGKLDRTPALTLRQADERALVQLTWALRSEADVDLSAAALSAAGVTIVAQPGLVDEAYGITILDPDGTRIRLAVLPVAASAPIARNDRPLLLSHIVLNSPDPARLIDFYTATLGLTVSDEYERGLLTFLRCDQPQHHCLGISPGNHAGLNHFAMDCGDLDSLMRCIWRLQEDGHASIWGPGRHGPGGNIFCYFEDPAGFVPEVTCDVMQIDDAAGWQPQLWLRTPENGNTWGTGGPSKRAIELMSGNPSA
ncbi:VOC family protein [Novosphingobium flavum]|uniref:VOC family protein n=1 Tax=Novosphingobium aerophilum TaxID=2839843 RepID=UPI00163A1DC8|nr:VOC family protein [Novosphingobium aerophilum]MBC2662783.1 VOC family protein [Novosphingobium aerophilum]